MRFGTHGGRWKITVPATAALGCGLWAAVASSQSSTRGTQVSAPPATSSASRSGSTDPSLFPMASDMDLPRDSDPSLRMMRQNARRDEIKKHMEQNATRLLQLSAELRNDLQTREPTEADGKRLDEIAKLAHAVREQMKQ